MFHLVRKSTALMCAPSMQVHLRSAGDLLVAWF
jgi:hypothetical protein